MSSPDPAPLAIGLDLGTSSLKAVAVDADGRVLARASRGYSTSRPEPGGAEQEPADWLDACDRALQELAATADPARWGAIGLSGMLPTLVELDDELHPVGPAVTWEDGRAEPEAQRMLAQLDPDEVYLATGQRLDGRYLLPMHLRRARTGTGARRIASAKDHLLLHLTGELATDPSTATGYGCFDLARGGWDAAIVAAAGSPSLPPVVPSTTTLPLRATVATRWGCPPAIPVAVGGADSVLGAYGMGITAPGRIGMIAGTSTVLIGWSPDGRREREGRHLVTPMIGAGYGVELDLMTTGSALAWLAGILGLSDAAALTELAATAELDRAPLVLPHLGPGEQGALWDPALTGVVDGLTLGTSRAELARGLLAGIVVEAARCVALLRDPDGDATADAAEILLTGSGGASETFRRDLADATGLAVRYDPDEHDHSAVGAALLAGRAALGWPESAPTPAGAVTMPDPSAAPRWAQRRDRQDRVRVALRDARPDTVPANDPEELP